MTDERTTPPQRVPILTEVVQLSQSDSVDIPVDGPTDETSSTVQAPKLAASSVPLEHELVERIWMDVQRQVELMFEYRMRETLSPILSRATDAVLRETRQQLASTLREVVAKAVAQELTRHRDG